MAGALHAVGAATATEQGSEDTSGDGSQQASNGSPAGPPDLPPQIPSPLAISSTGLAAAAPGHAAAEATRTSWEGASPDVTEGLSCPKPGDRASMALDSLREVAAGQRLGRLGFLRNSAEAVHADGKPLPAAETAASNVVAPTAVMGNAAGLGTGLTVGGGEAAQRVVAGISPAAVESSSNSCLEAQEKQPSAATQPAITRSGNPFASPVPATRPVPTGETPQLGSPQPGASIPEPRIEGAVAGLDLCNATPRRVDGPAAPLSDSPAYSIPPTKRGRFAERSPARLVSAEELAQAAIEAATAALVRTAPPRPTRLIAAGTPRPCSG